MGADDAALATSAELLSPVNEAIAREVKVSVQYMLQHAVRAGRGTVARHTALTEQSKLVSGVVTAEVMLLAR